MPPMRPVLGAHLLLSSRHIERPAAYGGVWGALRKGLAPWARRRGARVAPRETKETT